MTPERAYHCEDCGNDGRGNLCFWCEADAEIDALRSGFHVGLWRSVEESHRGTPHVLELSIVLTRRLARLWLPVLRVSVLGVTFQIGWSYP